MNKTRDIRSVGTLGTVFSVSLVDELSAEMGSHAPRSWEYNGCPALPGIYGFLPQRSHHYIFTPREIYEIDRNTVYECIDQYGFKAAADEFGYDGRHREFARDYIITLPRLAHSLKLTLFQVIYRIGLLESEAKEIFLPPKISPSDLNKVGKA